MPIAGTSTSRRKSLFTKTAVTTQPPSVCRRFQRRAPSQRRQASLEVSAIARLKV